MGKVVQQRTLDGTDNIYPVTVLEAVYDGRTGLTARQLIENIKPSEFSAATTEEIQSLFNEEE